MNHPDLPGLMTTDEVADALRITRRTLLNRRSQGQAPRGFRVGKRVLFRRDVVRAYLEQRAADDHISARAS